MLFPMIIPDAFPLVKNMQTMQPETFQKTLENYKRMEPNTPIESWFPLLEMDLRHLQGEMKSESFEKVSKKKEYNFAYFPEIIEKFNRIKALRKFWNTMKSLKILEIKAKNHPVFWAMKIKEFEEKYDFEKELKIRGL